MLDGQGGLTSRAEISRVWELGQQRRAVYLLAWWQGEAGPARQGLQLASLVITCFPHLSQSQKLSLFVLALYLIYFSHGPSSFPFLSSIWVLVPPPPHIDQWVWVFDACLEAIAYRITL